MSALKPKTWGRVEGLLRRANRIAGLVIYVNDGVAELWHNERSGDKPYEERGFGRLEVDVSSIVSDAVPDPDPLKVMLEGRTRFTVPSSYGDASVDGKSEWASFEEAVAAARSTIKRTAYPTLAPREGDDVEDGVVVVYVNACVALRARWCEAPQGDVGGSTDSELLRWKVTRSHVILSPLGHGVPAAGIKAAEALGGRTGIRWA